MGTRVVVQSTIDVRVNQVLEPCNLPDDTEMMCTSVVREVKCPLFQYVPAFLQKDFSLTTVEF